MSTNEITQGVIWKQLLKFFYPIMLGTLFQQMYSTADAMIVGKFIGSDALAAVGSTGVYSNLLVGFFVGLSGGAGVVISQQFGAGKEKLIQKSVHTAIALSVVGGVIVCVLGIFLSPLALTLMNTPESIFQMAYGYLRIYFLGMFPALVYNMGTAVFRAIGDSRKPLYFLIVATIVNIALDLLLVLVFHMGVDGTAAATVISQFVSAILILGSLSRQKEKPYQLFWGKIRLHREELVKMLKIGLPTGIQAMMYNMSNLIIQVAVNGFGTATIAAWAAYGKVDFIYWMIVESMGISVMTVAGQNFGAGKIGRIHETVKSAMLITAAWTITMSVLLGVFSGPLLSLFINEANVLAIGVHMMRLLTPFYITYIAVEILSGAIRGTGDSFLPTVFTVLGICALRALWIFFVLPQHHSLETVVASYPVSWILTSVVFIIYYRKGKWLKGS